MHDCTFKTALRKMHGSHRRWRLPWVCWRFFTSKRS